MDESNARYLNRITNELKTLSKDTGETFTTFVYDPKDVTNVTCVLEGPADTPYAGHKYQLKLDLKNYPGLCPELKFINIPWNPDVEEYVGYICPCAL
jgi:ubiquitin-protein ligase